MKRLIFISILLAFTIKSNAQDFEKTKTIQDYFNLLRNEPKFEIKNCNWLNEKRFKKTLDIKNGLISFSLLNDNEPALQMALFKDNKKEDLIVIHFKKYVCADYFACPETDGIQTYFLKYKDARLPDRQESWVDVSDEVLPQISVKIFYEDSLNTKNVLTYAPHAISYELPHIDQTVRLKLEICEGYINYDEVEPKLSNEQIDKLLEERRIRFLKWDKRFGQFLLVEL